MTDYRAIKHHIRREHLETSAWLGDVIATAIVGAWHALSRAGASLRSGTAAPREYSTALPRRF